MVGEHRTYAASKSRWRDFEQFKGPVIANLKDIARSVATDDHLSQEEKKAKLDRLRKCALDIHQVTVEAAERGKALDELHTNINREADEEADSSNDSAHLRKMFDSSMANARGRVDAALRHTDRDPPADLRELDDLVRAATGEADADDLQVDVTATEPGVVRCPVTGRTIDGEAWINRACGHYISLEGAITHLLQSNNRARSRALPPTSLDELPPQLEAKCPTVGCDKKIRPASLKRDYEREATQRIANRSRREAAAAEVDDLVG